MLNRAKSKFNEYLLTLKRNRKFLSIVHQVILGISGDQYYGYIDNLLEVVTENFKSFGLKLDENSISLVPSLYQDTLKIHEPVSLAHIDYDWYESVFLSLHEIVPHLVKGGTLIIDDYDAYSGCKKAVDEYFDDRHDEFTFIRNSRLHIVKN